MGLEKLKSVFSNIEPMKKTDLTQMVSQRTEGHPGPVNYMSDKKATGFTLNQEQKNTQFVKPIVSDYSSLSSVNYFDDKHATGFTQNMKDTQFISPYSSKFNILGSVNYFEDVHSTGFTKNMKDTQFVKPVDSDYSSIGSVDYFEDIHAKGFTPSMQETQFIKPITSELLSGHPGPVNFFHDGHAKGFTLNLQQGSPSQFNFPILSIFDDLKNVDYFNTGERPYGFTDHFNTTDKSELAPQHFAGDYVQPETMLDTFGEIGHAVDYFNNKFANGFTLNFTDKTDSQFTGVQSSFIVDHPNLTAGGIERYFENGEINVNNLFTYPFTRPSSGTDKTYDTYNYDPRPISLFRPYIQTNPYKGSQYDSPLGGLFNDVQDTSEPFDKYSTMWGEINKPTLLDIVNDGNLAQFGNGEVQGVGYPRVVPLVEEFYSQVGSIPISYQSNGSINLNNWINSGEVIGLPHISELNYNPNIQGLNTSANSITFNGDSENPVRSIEIDSNSVKAHTILDIFEENKDRYDRNSVNFAFGGNIFGQSPKWKAVLDTDHIEGGLYWINGPNGRVVAASATLDTYGILMKNMPNSDWEDALRFTNRVVDIPDLVFEADISDQIDTYEKQAKDWVDNKIVEPFQRKMAEWKDEEYVDPKDPDTSLKKLEKAAQKEWKYTTYNFTKWTVGDPYTLTPPTTGDALGSIGDGGTHFLKLFNDSGDPQKFTHETAIQTDAKGKQKEVSQIIYENTETKATEISQKSPLSPDIQDDRDGMPFYIKDLRTNEYIFFRAFIEGLTENLVPTWSPQNYIGRSEPVYVYERGERDVAFSLKLFAHTRHELQAIYQKLDRLTSLVYPDYETDAQWNQFAQAVGTEKYGSGKIRMKPPLAMLRVGDLYGRQNDEMLGFIKGLTYSFPDNSPWASRAAYSAAEKHAYGIENTTPEPMVPKHVIVNLTWQVIHRSTPSRRTLDFSSFYGYNDAIERKTFGGGDSTVTTEIPMNMSTTYGPGGSSDMFVGMDEKSDTYKTNMNQQVQVESWVSKQFNQ